MAKVYGECCICGLERELSFEHVPPRAAFNNSRVFLVRGEHLFGGTGLIDTDSPDARQQQRGAGAYTLCIPCNNTTGGWYGAAYADWARQAALLLEASRGEVVLAYPFKIFPLRVVKQLVSMFMSANGPEFRRKAPYLEKFVMDKRQTGLPSDIRLYAGYNHGRFSRTTGIVGLVDDGTVHGLSEITYRPFAFVMALASPPPNRQMIDITSFAEAHIDDPRVLYLSMPVLNVRSQFPADYRSEDEILRAAAAHAKRPSAT
ncbi:MAG: hypothetical protein WA190_00040 [Usitatibacter sp.]